jgi:hypothetical protein
MFQTYKKLYGLFDDRERRRVVLLLALMILVAFIEALGVASIMPFIAMLTNPEVVDTNPYLALAFDRLGFTSEMPSCTSSGWCFSFSCWPRRRSRLLAPGPHCDFTS